MHRQPISAGTAFGGEGQAGEPLTEFEAIPADMAPHPSVLGGIPFDHLSAVSSNIYSAPMEVTQSAFQTAQALLGLSRQSVPGESQAEVLPAYEAEQIQGALALLQKQQVSQPVTPADDSDLRTRVMQALRSRHGYAEKKAIPEHEEGAIDMISQLVESITSDVLVTDALKPRLRRLEVPLLNVAMREPEFFSESDHPARQVVNRLAQIPGARDGSLDQGVARSVDSIVDNIVDKSSEDASVFSDGVRKLDTLVAQQERLRGENLNQVIESCEQQQALIKARTGGAPASTTDE